MSTPIYSIAANNVSGQLSVVLATRISENIRRLREEKGWSRPCLANHMRPPTSGQQIEKLEKGERRLTVDWIERVSTALGVDPGELIAGQGQQFTLDESVASEVAASLARVVLQGREPSPDIVADLSLILRELSETFSRHQSARHDPEVARPVIDLLVNKRGRRPT